MPIEFDKDLSLQLDKATKALEDAERKRHQVLIYWNNRCGMCNTPGRLQVHHRTPDRLGHEFITDLIPLRKVSRCRAWWFGNNSGNDWTDG